MPDENNTTVITPRYYQRLSSVITPDDIPEILGFLKEGIQNLLDTVYYKDLQYNKSPRGDAAFYSLSIVGKRMGIELPGTGIYILLNPDAEGDAISAFPVTVEYEWKILAYLRSFNLEGFSFTPQEFFEIALRVLNLSEEQVIAHFINTFTTPADSTVTSIEQFINDINEVNNLNIDTPTGETTLSTVVSQIYQQSGKYASLIGFKTYLLTQDLTETKNKLKTFFRLILPQDIESYIKDILIPKFKATLTLSAGIEFPRSILQPVDSETQNVIEGDQKVVLSFGEALFYADTEKGFGYNMDIAVNTSVPAMLGNTGLILEINNLKIDLSDTENIAEADLDGRPATFKGVYADYLGITLPKKWFNDDTVQSGSTARIAGYNLLLGTGGISGTIALETVAFKNNDGTVTDYYGDYFALNYPVKTIHKTTNNNIVTTSIADKPALLTQLENFPDSAFIYPISLVKNGETPATQFNTPKEYHNYLNTLYDEGDVINQPRITKRFGTNGFEIWFTRFDITFRQGHVVESGIQGGLKIPRLKDSLGNDAEIEIVGHLEDDGGFNITASERDGFGAIRLPQVLDLTIKSLEVGRDSSEDPFYIGTSCDIVFTNDIIKSFLGEDTSIHIERLRIYSNGSMEIEGGAVSVPKNFKMNLGPVEISISAIHFGSYQGEHGGQQRKYNYFGFDGAIGLDPLGVDARGKGIEYYFTIDDNGEEGDEDYKPHHSFIRINTIEVDILIPGNASPESATAIIKGWLSISDDEYAGGVSVKLPDLKIAGEADMRMQPKYPAWVVDASLELPFAIPLAASGLGITGFRGLAGYRYLAEKEAIGLHSHDDKWYDYYTYPKRGVNVKKMRVPEETGGYTNPMAIGAGVTINTISSKDVLSLRVMALLSCPNVLVIDGRGSILSKQYGLDDTNEPPFFAFLVIADNGIEVGAGLTFKIPKSSGSILDMNVGMEAGFFYDNPSGWYVNLGTVDSPISAKVLSLVQMQSYLMISASGIAAGAKVVFDLKERFGPIKLEAWFIAEVGGRISFERPQIGGYMGVDAGAKVNLFNIVKVSINFAVIFSVEAAEPFLIYAEIRVCGKIKVAFVKIKVCATVKMKWEKSRKVNTEPIDPIGEEQRAQLIQGVHMLTAEPFALYDFGSVEPNLSDPQSPYNDMEFWPLDTYVDIKINKGLLPGDISTIIGGYTNPPENYEDLVPPDSVVKGNTLRQVKHQYKIKKLTIKAASLDSNTWKESYHTYEALVPEEERSTVDDLRIGYWQKSGKEYNAIRLLADAPFSYVEQGEPGWIVPEQLGLSATTMFCQASLIPHHYANWLLVPSGTVYVPYDQFPYYYTHQQMFFNVGLGQGTTVEGLNVNTQSKVVSKPNVFGFARSLQIPNTGKLEIKLPEPSREVSLKVSSTAEKVKVIYYKSILPPGAYQVEFVPINSVDYTQAQLMDTNGIIYENLEVPIAKIGIFPFSEQQSRIDAIYQQIEALYNQAYAEAGLESSEYVDVSTLIDTQAYNALVDELSELLDTGCSQCYSSDAVCNLYTGLQNMYDSYYPETVSDSAVVYGFVSYYQDFIHQITNELQVYLDEIFTEGEIQMYNLDFDKFTYYHQQGDISGALGYYFSMRASAAQMLHIIYQWGGCQCLLDGCAYDGLLCDLYNSLYEISSTCLTPQTDVKRISLDCLQHFSEYLTNFNTTNSSYNFANTLGSLWDNYFYNYQQILNNSSGGIVEQEGLPYYNALLGIIDELLPFIYQWGDCGCAPTNIYEMQGECFTLVHEIGWLTVSDYTYNVNLPSQDAIAADYQAAVDGMTQVIAPIWRPNTRYLVQFELQDVVNDDSTTPPFIYNFGFKTAGPLGHYHNAPGVTYANETNVENPGVIINRDEDGRLINPDRYPLASLKEYIDYRRSYPNADGNLLESKPFFYGDPNTLIRLFYVKRYVPHMFKEVWDAYGSELPEMKTTNTEGELQQAFKVFLQDPVSNLIMQYPLPAGETEYPGEPNPVETWETDTNPVIPFTTQLFLNLAANATCLQTGGGPIVPLAGYAQVIPGTLKPNKLYKVIVNNLFNDKLEEVHKYVLKTSRYANFEDQIQSMVLEETETETVKAIFEVPLDLNSTQLARAYAMVSGNSVSDIQEETSYMDHFDRVLEGILQLPPMHTSETTEVNCLRDTNTGAIVGLLIRNPEPFNDPKIPLEEIQESIGIVSGMNGEVHHIMYSKDYSQALIMPESLAFLAQELTLEFTYKLWNGSVYEVLDQVQISVQLP